MKVSNTAERLKQIMRERNLRQADLVELVAPYCEKYHILMGKSSISLYVNGKVEPNQGKLFILGQALNVSEAWLMGFDVPPERKNEVHDFAVKLSEEETAIIETAASTPASKEMLMEYAKKLAQLNQIKDETGH